MVFMLEAILLFSPISSVIRGAGYSIKRQWHWILQACTVLSALTGFFVITTNKYMADKQHYTSWHGLLGMRNKIECLFSMLLFLQVLLFVVLSIYQW